MYQPLELLQQIFVAPAPELAMLNDVVEILYGTTTLIGTVVEGDPKLDDDFKTWFKVTGVKAAYDGTLLTVSSWVTDIQLLPAKAGRLSLAASAATIKPGRLLPDPIRSNGWLVESSPAAGQANNREVAPKELVTLNGFRDTTIFVSNPYPQFLSCVAVSFPDFVAGKCLQPTLYSSTDVLSLQGGMPHSSPA